MSSRVHFKATFKEKGGRSRRSYMTSPQCRGSIKA